MKILLPNGMDLSRSPFDVYVLSSLIVIRNASVLIHPNMFVRYKEMIDYG